MPELNEAEREMRKAQVRREIGPLRAAGLTVLPLLRQWEIGAYSPFKWRVVFELVDGPNGRYDRWNIYVWLDDEWAWQDSRPEAGGAISAAQYIYSYIRQAVRR